MLCTWTAILLTPTTFCVKLSSPAQHSSLPDPEILPVLPNITLLFLHHAPSQLNGSTKSYIQLHSTKNLAGCGFSHFQAAL
ncbi:hypothetical protein DEU56DRAFT_392918 [Suillus clintonianus]|uniref:uncharacterized protein n=1 Tax=Suillus clintonianus TaxID=1904413 RepID=UPI001B862578|nr:uncharacterized protein DEU56DRAFT_392918 [Suillus clintonianus]KAG2135465.1 hypothetical protein DEU56DRAFT_392918 [Suillus clintonianus]